MAINPVTIKSAAWKLAVPPMELNNERSARAKGVADRLIATLGEAFVKAQEETAELLSPEDEKELEAIFSRPKTVEQLKNGERGGIPFLLMTKGTRSYVWKHPSHPRLVFKAMTAKKAQEELAGAKKVAERVKRENLFWYKTPKATVLGKGEIQVYVEERLPIGLRTNEAKEVWVRILTHYQSQKSSDLFKMNLREVVDQTETIFVQEGIWDGGYLNCPELRLDGKGVCAIDFAEIKPDHQHVVMGLKQLREVIPIDPLGTQINERYLGMLEEEVNVRKARFASEKIAYPQLPTPSTPTISLLHEEATTTLERSRKVLRAEQEALLYYDNKSWVFSSEESPPPEMDESMQMLLQLLLKRMEQRASAFGKDKTLTLTEKRIISVTPAYRFDDFFPYYTRGKFLEMLHYLKDQGKIASWYEVPLSNDTSTFGIYF